MFTGQAEACRFEMVEKTAAPAGAGLYTPHDNPDCRGIFFEDYIDPRARHPEPVALHRVKRYSPG